MRMAEEEDAWLPRMRRGQNVDDRSKPLSQALQRQIVQELPSPEEPWIGIAELRIVGPCCINHRTSAEYPYP